MGAANPQKVVRRDSDVLEELGVPLESPQLLPGLGIPETDIRTRRLLRVTSRRGRLLADQKTISPGRKRHGQDCSLAGGQLL